MGAATSSAPPASRSCSAWPPPPGELAGRRRGSRPSRIDAERHDCSPRRAPPATRLAAKLGGLADALIVYEGMGAWLRGDVWAAALADALGDSAEGVLVADAPAAPARRPRASRRRAARRAPACATPWSAPPTARSRPRRPIYGGVADGTVSLPVRAGRVPVRGGQVRGRRDGGAVPVERRRVRAPAYEIDPGRRGARGQDRRPGRRRDRGLGGPRLRQGRGHRARQAARRRAGRGARLLAADRRGLQVAAQGAPRRPHRHVGQRRTCTWPSASPGRCSTSPASRARALVVAVNNDAKAPIVAQRRLRHRRRPLQGDPRARGRARRRILREGGAVGIDYVREYLPFLPHTATLIAMYTCVAVVVALFVWGFVAPLPRYRRGGASLWAAVNGEGPAVGAAPLARGCATWCCRPRSSSAACRPPCTSRSSTARSCCSSAPASWWSTRTSCAGSATSSSAASSTCSSRACSTSPGSRSSSASASPCGGGSSCGPSTSRRRLATTLVLFGLLFMGLSGFGLEAYRIAAQPANDWAAAAFVGSRCRGLLDGWASGRRRAGHRLPGALVAARRRRVQPHRRAGLDRPLARARAAGERGRARPGAPADRAHDAVQPHRRDGVGGGRRARRRDGDHHRHRPAGAPGRRRLRRLRALPPGVPGQRRRAGALAARPRAGHPAVAGHRPRRRGRRAGPPPTSRTPCGRAPTATPASRLARRGSVTSTTSSTSAAPSSTRTASTSRSRACCRRSTATRTRTSCPRTSAPPGSPSCPTPTRSSTAWPSSPEPPEYLYWIGCAAAYDERTSAVARATMDLLRAAGVSFLTLGPAEPCCGEPAKRLGEEGRFQMIAMAAIEMIKETGARKIVTALPARPQHLPARVPGARVHDPGGAPLGAARRAGRRGPPGARRGRRRRRRGSSSTTSPATSPAPAGRRPRRSGSSAAPPPLPPRSGARTFCCGGGGGNSFYQVEQEERRISALRYEELAATGAERVAVSCPFCLTMLRDAAAAQGEAACRWSDVAEVLRARLEEAATAADSAGSTR